MKKQRFSTEQIISVLKQAEIVLAQGASIGEMYRRLSVSE